VPDPKDPTPVRAVKRGDKWFVVDSSGKTMPDTGAMDSAEAVRVAREVNESWKRARKERGGRLEEAFNRILHPRVPKLRKGGGQFAEKLAGRQRPRHPGGSDAWLKAEKENRPGPGDRGYRRPKFPNVSAEEKERILRPIGHQLEQQQRHLPEGARKIGHAPRIGGGRKQIESHPEPYGGVLGVPGRLPGKPRGRQGFATGLKPGDHYWLDDVEYEVVRAPTGSKRKITARRVKDGREVELDKGTVVEWPKRKA
jgi:hypothetical protein